MYILILYCSGFCPSWLPAPNGVLFYSSLAECQATMTRMGDSTGHVFDGKGKLMAHTHFKETCATMYAEPEQLDRILNPKKLEQFLKDNGIPLK